MIYDLHFDFQVSLSIKMDAKTRYCFVTEWFDIHAQLTRTYEFFFYPVDQTIELYDVKLHRTFLKRSKSNFKQSDLFIGASININARLLVIKDYSDEFTRSHLAVQLQNAVLVVKPNGCKHLGTIIDGLITNGFAISRIQSVALNRETMAQIKNYITSEANHDSMLGTSIVIEVLRSMAVENLHALIGIVFLMYR